MAGIVSIETIVPCRDSATFHASVQRYLQTLISMGIGEPGLLAWGKRLHWHEPDDPIDPAWPRPQMHLKEQDESFEVQLAIRPWIEADGSQEKLVLSLHFDIEEAIGPGAPFDPNLMYYKRSFGRLVWRIMQEIFKHLPGYGCYLEDEGSRGLLWAMDDGKKSDFWEVSLGIAPRKIYEHYLPAPKYVVLQRSDEVGIFGLRAHWEVFPWDEQ